MFQSYLNRPRVLTPEHIAKSQVNRANGNLIASRMECTMFQPNDIDNFRAISLIITQKTARIGQMTTWLIE